MRTPAEHPLRLHSWRIRFYAAATMFQPPPEAADACLREVLSRAAGVASQASAGEVPTLEALISSAASGGRVVRVGKCGRMMSMLLNV